MTRFKSGQHVVLAHGCAWSINDYGPKLNEVVTVDRYVDSDFIVVQEYLFDPSGEDQSFQEIAFEPLPDISELTSILESEPITETA